MTWHRILEDTLSQNFRIRQLLQRVSANVKEFDSVRCSLSNTLGIPYDSISPEVLDAFTHDPAAVTGNTSALEGWQAVDSIHERILLQRQTLQSFISSLSQGQSFLDMPSSVLKDPISSVMQSMADLETYQSQMVQQAQGVMDALARVKVIHSEVKKEYNDTLSHTSLVYPEVRPYRTPSISVTHTFLSSHKLSLWRKIGGTTINSSGTLLWMHLPCYSIP